MKTRVGVHSEYQKELGEQEAKLRKLTASFNHADDTYIAFNEINEAEEPA